MFEPQTGIKIDEMRYNTSFFFLTEDHGTSHVSVIDAQGNAVAATSTINTA